ALDRGEGPGSPPLLAAAMRHAVMPGGARIRPKLTLAVAGSLGARRRPGVAAWTGSRPVMAPLSDCLDRSECLYKLTLICDTPA
ncbi:hypothetical protein CCR85_12915, partial [Rhodothalassium salexigens]